MKSEYAAHICKEADDVKKEIEVVSKFLVGEENDKNTDTLKKMFDKVMSTPRTIFVNKGHDNTQLVNDPRVHNHYSTQADGTFRTFKGERIANEFNGVFEKATLSFDKAKAIADYARTKGITIRKLLENNGFNVSFVPKDTNLVTAKAFDDSVSNASQLLGYNYQKACYKGVNIDAKGAGEANVQLIDCGYSSWKFSQWNYSLPGNACAMVIK